MSAISFGLIKDIEMPMPSILHQDNIINKIDTILSQTQMLETIYQRKLDSLAELKQSIVQISVENRKDYARTSHYRRFKCFFV